MICPWTSRSTRSLRASALPRALAIAAGLLLPASVWARPGRIYQIPSTPNGCFTCHKPPRTALSFPRNDFGDAVEASLLPAGEQGEVQWSVVCPQDSDGDGASNGAELGDPECNWPEDPGVDTAYDPADPAVAPPGSGGGAGGGSGGGSGGGTGGGSGGGSGSGSGGGGSGTGSADLGPTSPSDVGVVGSVVSGPRRPYETNENSRYGPGAGEGCRSAPSSPSLVTLVGMALLGLRRPRRDRPARRR